MAVTERKQASSASRIRALLQLRDKADAEIAKLLAAEKKDRGTDDWLAWCEKEFGWGKAMAYRRLDPEQVQDDRDSAKKRAAESRSSRHDEPEPDDEAEEDHFQGPVFQMDPLSQALSDLVRQTKRKSAASVVRVMQKQYDGGDGFDVTLKDELVRVRDWIDELIRGIEPLIVSCAVNSNGGQA